MSVTITVNEIKAFIPAAASINDTDLQMYIGVVARADACLDSSNVDANTQRLLKLSAIGHLLTKRFGGQVTSQEDFDGARIAWQQYQTKGSRLESTTFGQTVEALDQYGCMRFVNGNSGKYIQAVGAKYER